MITNNFMLIERPIANKGQMYCSYDLKKLYKDIRKFVESDESTVLEQVTEWYKKQYPLDIHIGFNVVGIPFDKEQLCYLIELLKDIEYTSYVDFGHSIDITVDYVLVNHIGRYDIYNLDKKYDVTIYNEIFSNLRQKVIDNVLLDIDFVNLLHLIKVFEVDNVCNVSSVDMPKFINTVDYINEEKDKRYINEMNDFNDYNHDDYNRLKKIYSVNELLGCYFNEECINSWNNYTRLFKQFPFARHTKNVIFVCEENIIKQIDYFNNLENKEKYDRLFTDYLREMVLTHEFGHLVFNYTSFIVNKEKQANYFSSFITRGIYDALIERLSSMQPTLYHDPLLYSKYAPTLVDFLNSTIKNLYYQKKNKTFHPGWYY